MAYIHVYMGNPTAAGVDGTLVSEGSGAAPVSVGPLNASLNEVSAGVKLALRCEAGFRTTATTSTTVTPTGTSAAKWALSWDNVAWVAYGAPLTTTNQVTAANMLFYARAQASAGETPQNDTTVTLQVQATVEPG